MQPRRVRIRKPLLRQVQELEDHLYLIRTHLHGLRKDIAHLKDLASGLRALVCFSSGTEGLLWRLVDRLKVADDVKMHVTRGVREDHPLARGLRLNILPLSRPDDGLAASGLPWKELSLKDALKNHAAVYAIGTNCSFEQLIKMVAEQVGSAHEDDGVEPKLSVMEELLINGTAPYVDTLAKVAGFTLEVGDRVIGAAEQTSGYRRRRFSVPWTASLELIPWELPLGRVHLLDFVFHTAGLQVSVFLTPQSILFSLQKENGASFNVRTPLPVEWRQGVETACCVSYDHRSQKLEALSAGERGDSVRCDLGFVDPDEAPAVQADPTCRPYVNLRGFFVHAQLFTPDEVAQIPGILIRQPLVVPPT